MELYLSCISNDNAVFPWLILRIMPFFLALNFVGFLCFQHERLFIQSYYCGCSARLILWKEVYMLSRITVAICESMAGVGGKRRLLSGGTGFLAISGIVFVFLVFNIWRDYVMLHFSLL